MVFKYLSIEFSGSQKNVLKFFELKNWNFEVKNVGTRKIFLKIEEDLVDEIKFFKNMEIDELSGSQILTVKKIYLFLGRSHPRIRICQYI